MFDDYIVDQRSDAQIRSIAKRARSSFAVVTEDRVDLLACLKKISINTEYGDKALKFERRADSEMPAAEGMTIFSPREVTIVLPERTISALKFGQGRARNTVAHEIGHAVMHQGPPLHRGAVSKEKFKWLPPYRSAEHQAKVFASAFLVDDGIALKLADEIEIAIRFGISEESAQIYLNELRKPERRKLVAYQFRDFSQTLGANDSRADGTIHFLLEACPNCGERTLFPVGTKFMCKSCDGVFDRFQDGDSVDF